MSAKSLFGNLKNDLPASIVVFFVAVPLCLGIALASGAPSLFSGLIAGIVGGIVVGGLSGSRLGVSGPAAGLAAIVLKAIDSLNGFENFLVAVVIAGVIQIIFGILKGGVIGYFFPNSVIKGMLTGIGIIIILKQIPHFFGYDSDPEGALNFNSPETGNTFSQIFSSLNHITPGSVIIGLIALLILIFWDKHIAAKFSFLKFVQGPLVAVFVGIIYILTTNDIDAINITSKHLVNVPVPDGFDSFKGQFSFPNFGVINNPEVWVVAFTLALVASLETLLSVEATDKLDPDKNTTPTNRELFAQGAGNILSGMIGGLPVTQVIVRSSANIQSKAKTKLSTILHGFFLLISVLLIPNILNLIPLSVLAAILFVVGYKLAKPQLFLEMYKLGIKQFLPFIVTVVAIIFTDLLVGIGLGLAVGIVVILYKSYQNSHFLHIENNEDGNNTLKMTMAEEVTFFNKAAILNELGNVPENSKLEIDVRQTRYLDNDIIEIMEDFVLQAKSKNIDVLLISERGTVMNPESYIKFFNLKKQ